MSLLVWLLIAGGLLIFLIPILLKVTRSRGSKVEVIEKPDSNEWDINESQKSRSGKPVARRVQYSGKFGRNFRWEMEAVSKDDPQQRISSAYQNVSLVRSSFYTFWEIEESFIEDGYILMTPRNVLALYPDLNEQHTSNDHLEQKLERFLITDIRKLFNLSIEKAEEVYSEMSRIYPSNKAFRNICQTYATHPGNGETLMTPQLQSTIVELKANDICLGVSPNRSVILLSGVDLAGETPRLENLVWLGQTLLENQKHIVA